MIGDPEGIGATAGTDPFRVLDHHGDAVRDRHRNGANGPGRGAAAGCSGDDREPGQRPRHPLRRSLRRGRRGRRVAGPAGRRHQPGPGHRLRMSGRTVARRASTGAWCMVHPGVYLVAGHRPGHESRVRAAALRAGPRATSSGPAAAFWHRMLDEPPGTIGFTVPRTMHRVPAPGVTLRRRVLDPADRTVLHGVAVTTPTCTVLETAPVAGPRSSTAPCNVTSASPSCTRPAAGTWVPAGTGGWGSSSSHAPTAPTRWPSAG